MVASCGAAVAAREFAAPSVVVAYTDDPEIRTGAKLKQHGLQIAAGVPLMCGERDDFSSFRVGLFGLDKLTDVDGTIDRLAARLSSRRLAALGGTDPQASAAPRSRSDA